MRERESEKERERLSERVKNVLICQHGLDVSGDSNENLSWETNCHVAGVFSFSLSLSSFQLNVYVRVCVRVCVCVRECVKTTMSVNIQQARSHTITPESKMIRDSNYNIDQSTHTPILLAANGRPHTYQCPVHIAHLLQRAGKDIHCCHNIVLKANLAIHKHVWVHMLFFLCKEKSDGENDK